MIINVNGEEMEIEEGSTLLCIIKKRDLVPERIVVECNKEIISKDKFGDVVVGEKDRIEILSFVGGG